MPLKSPCAGAEIASFIAKYTPEPAIRSLIEQALIAHREAFLAAAPLRTVIKSVSAKQPARRPSVVRSKR